MEFQLEAGPDLVLIAPDEIKREAESKILMSDDEKKTLERQQNRGKIINVGENVKFWKVDDYVSFYRNAATPIKEAGTEYLSIHYGHILVRFIEKTA